GSSFEVLTFSCERLFLFYLSTNVHTYHLFFFKDRFVLPPLHSPIKRFVYHQQRNEIMYLFLSPVKPFFDLFYKTSKKPDLSSPLTATYKPP
ncbi:hypothetical protein OFAG_02383, partial [Oxalobacter formigenes HOxBLS]